MTIDKLLNEASEYPDRRPIPRSSAKRWRLSDAEIENMRGKDLTGLNLRYIDLNHVDLGRVNFSYCDLLGADLSYANMQGSNFVGVNLAWADLTGADLSFSVMSNANLYKAELFHTNFTSVNLACANFYSVDAWDANFEGSSLYKAAFINADLSYANFSKTFLRGADLSLAKFYKTDLKYANIDDGTVLYNASLVHAMNIPYIPMVCPDHGSFIGFKQAHHHIVVLEIQEDAKRSSATTRKCRCSKAKVIAIENLDGSISNLKEIHSDYDANFIYKVEEIVEVDDFDENRWNECSTGIHFFINREEAVRFR